MATGYIHGATESIPGNETNAPVLSTKVLYPPAVSFAPRLQPSHLMRDDEIRNLDEPLMALTERYAPEWDLESRMYPDTLGFLLKLIFGAPVTTAGNGVITDPDGTVIPIGATRHVWTAPFGPSGAFPMTAQWQVAYKDQGAFFKLKGAGCRQLSIETPETGGARIKASGPALYMQRITDPALTPAYESLAIPPFERGHLQIVTWLGGTGTTEDFTVNVENPMDPVATLGIASKFPDVLEKADSPITVTGSIPKRQLDIDDYDALLNATGFGTKARWLSTAIITGAYPYKFWVETDNSQYVSGGPNPLQNQRRVGATFDWKATSDGAGASSTFTLVNATASYA